MPAAYALRIALLRVAQYERSNIGGGMRTFLAFKLIACVDHVLNLASEVPLLVQSDDSVWLFPHLGQ